MLIRLNISRILARLFESKHAFRPYNASPLFFLLFGAKIACIFDRHEPGYSAHGHSDNGCGNSKFRGGKQHKKTPRCEGKHYAILMFQHQTPLNRSKTCLIDATK